MNERRSDIVSSVLAIFAMCIIAVPRLVLPTGDAVPALFDIDALALVTVAVILLGVGNIARHWRTG